MWQRRVALAVMVLLVAAVATAEALAVPAVKGVRIGQHDDKTRLVLDLTESAPFKIHALTGPNRLVIDMPPVHWALGEQTVAFHRAGVLRVRFGRFLGDTSRIVVDLAQPAVVQRTFLVEPSQGGSGAYRLVVDFGTLPVSAVPAKSRQTVVSASASIDDERQVAGVGQPTELVGQVRRVAHQRDPVKTTSETRLSVAAARAAEPEGGVTEPAPAVQQREPFLEARSSDQAEPVPLPRAKPSVGAASHLIAIDPGHGGRDPGAVAASGLQEKVLALTFARDLRAALEASGRYRSVMTRERDHKISLHRRVEVARDAGADLFLSIHVDLLDDHEVRGVSVYTLSDEASDVETAELAARENKADIVADVDLSEDYDEEVAKVLISMVQQNTMNCSAVLAATLLPELGRVAPLISSPHRFGDFRVLKAPDIPSVLVELGFLSNDQDAERLQSDGHRRNLAGAIVDALDTYFREPC